MIHVTVADIKFYATKKTLQSQSQGCHKDFKLLDGCNREPISLTFLLALPVFFLYFIIIL